MKKIYLLFLLNFIFPLTANAATYTIDPRHSTVLFKVDELAGYVSGLFGQFQGKVELNADNTQITALAGEVDVASVYTRNVQRDVDLLAAELLDAKKYPTAKFVSKKIEGDKITGDLTIKGKTKPASFQYSLLPITGNQARLSLHGAINRKDFGITYNRILEKGQMLLDDEVDLTLDLVGVAK